MEHWVDGDNSSRCTKEKHGLPHLAAPRRTAPPIARVLFLQWHFLDATVKRNEHTINLITKKSRFESGDSGVAIHKSRSNFAAQN